MFRDHPIDSSEGQRDVVFSLEGVGGEEDAGEVCNEALISHPTEVSAHSHERPWKARSVHHKVKLKLYVTCRVGGRNKL